MGIKPQKIILYGSYTQNNANRHSDIDLVVVSNDLAEYDLWDRQCILGRPCIEIDYPMDVMGFTEEEYAQKGVGTFIGDEVKTKGIEII